MNDTTMPDVSLIRDAGLRQILARHKQRNILPNMLVLEMQIRIEEQAKRDLLETARQSELEVMPHDQGRRAQVHDHFLNEEPQAEDLRHLHSVLAICGLPYDRAPLDVREYSREQGNMSIDVTAGSLRGPNGTKIIQPLLFGPKARLILMHLCSEAIRQQSPTIEIAETFTAFVRDMGFSDSAGI